MSNDNRKMQVRVDWYTRFCLTAISALLTVMVIGLWAEAIPSADARAAEPFLNASAQRKLMIDAQGGTNAKLDELIALLKSGQVRVQVVAEPTEKDSKPPRPGGSNVMSPATK